MPRSNWIDGRYATPPCAVTVPPPMFPLKLLMFSRSLVSIRTPLQCCSPTGKSFEAKLASTILICPAKFVPLAGPWESTLKFNCPELLISGLNSCASCMFTEPTSINAMGPSPLAGTLPSNCRSVSVPWTEERCTLIIRLWCKYVREAQQGQWRSKDYAASTAFQIAGTVWFLRDRKSEEE